jgi:uncharacterized protein (UPF0332 family)
MTFDDLLSKGLIKRYKATPGQVKSRIELAQRDLRTAGSLISTDPDWSYSIAYNAILQATRALMFAGGYRPGTGEGQHKGAVLFAEVALRERLKDKIFIFDKMRTKRHKVVYDLSGVISEAEAREAVGFAEQFVSEIEERLARFLK